MEQLEFTYEGYCGCCGKSNEDHKRFRLPVSWLDASLTSSGQSLYFLDKENAS